MKNVRSMMLGVLILGIAMALVPTTVSAQDEWPLASGDYWDITGIDIKDGGSWKYANWLATEWRENAEFAKSKGWIKDYMVIANIYGRQGEPDLFLIRVLDYLPTGEEGDKRGREYREWKEKSIEKMVGESGNRAEYREVLSSSLMQVLSFRD